MHMLLYCILISLIPLIKCHNNNCACSANDLNESDKLSSEFKRVRIETSDAKSTYANDQLFYNVQINCSSIAVYDSTRRKTDSDSQPQRSYRMCKTCSALGWSEFEPCRTSRCLRSALVGAPPLERLDGTPAAADQSLFAAGEVVAVHWIAGERVCKACEASGRWSTYAQESLCAPATLSQSECSYSTLKHIESQQPEYVRLRIESPDGMSRIDESRLGSRHKLPYRAVVVYQRYLPALSSDNSAARSRVSLFRQMSVDSSPNTKKFCRYCEDGIWTQIESCVSLNCDRSELRGSPQLFNAFDESSADENRHLFQPLSVIAVYSFSNDRFCKQCHENGEWSKFSLAELCTFQSHLLNRIPTTTKPNPNPNQNRNRYLQGARQQQISARNKDVSCDLAGLETVEAQYSNKTVRILLASSDLKRKLTPSDDAQIPSGSVAIYRIVNTSGSALYCSICSSAGVWSNIAGDCATMTPTRLHFCLRDDLKTPPSVIKLSEYEQAPVYQDLFQPGAAMAIFDISDTTKLCKVCASDQNGARWSKYAESNLCAPAVAFSKSVPNSSCSAKDLEGTQTSRLTKVRIQSSSHLGRQLITTDIVPDGSIAVFKSREFEFSPLKMCKKCTNGQWGTNFFVCPSEYSKSKCDPLPVKSANYFVNISNGLKLSNVERKLLANPGDAVAVYQFGSQKYCRICYENGTWSSYPQFQLCKLIKLID